MVASKRIIMVFFFAGCGLILSALLGFAPRSEARAWQGSAQSADDCATCHEQAVDLLADSLHAEIPLKCDNCHKLVPGAEGAKHPELYYSTESEENTCVTCHGDASTQWYDGQHGDLNMDCATCHEPHSLQQKLIGSNQTTCEACHKKQVNAGHGSTHAAAGATCSSCHIGNETGHGFNATLATCNSCHEDIHDANRLVASGFEFSAPPTATEEPASGGENGEGAESGLPEEQEPEEQAGGGVQLPSWLFLVAGLLVGGGVIWVVLGKDPGVPTEEKK